MGCFISDISLVYLRYLPVISLVYLKYITGISRVYFGHISSILPIYIRHILSKSQTYIPQNTTKCCSSEEMRAAFIDFNKKNEEIKRKCEIISMDVKALYPSMGWSEIVKSVKWMIQNSEMKIANVDWHEVGKYLAVTMAPEDIAAEGLVNVIPTRQGLRLRKITINYLKQKKMQVNGRLQENLVSGSRRRC